MPTKDPDNETQESSRLLPKLLLPKEEHICILENDEIFQQKLKSGNKAFAKLAVVVAICFMFMIVEVGGGIWSDSLAILTDAAHMLSDVAGFGISMISIKVAQKKPTSQMTYGYHRAEVLGALASVMIIQFMVFYLSWQATQRILNPESVEIKGPVMLVTAFVSLFCNLFNLAALGHIPVPCFGEPLDDPHSPRHAAVEVESSGSSKSEEENLNVRAAVVHIIGDMLQSVGVITAATLITFYPSAQIADPICTYLFSIMVIMTTAPVTRDCMRILMEVQPHTVDLVEFRQDVMMVEGVQEIQDMHVWALSGGKNVLTVHIRQKQDERVNQAEQIYKRLLKIVDTYDISHFTAQIL